MVENALTAGFISMGWEVNLLGPLPTPAVSFLTKSLRADLGIMISASHNPYEDNGIKFFDKDGLKIDTIIEEAISKEIKNKPQLVAPNGLGRARRIDDVLGPLYRICKDYYPNQFKLKWNEDSSRLRQWRRIQNFTTNFERTRCRSCIYRGDSRWVQY